MVHTVILLYDNSLGLFIFRDIIILRICQNFDHSVFEGERVVGNQATILRSNVIEIL